MEREGKNKGFLSMIIGIITSIFIPVGEVLGKAKNSAQRMRG